MSVSDEAERRRIEAAARAAELARRQREKRAAEQTQRRFAQQDKGERELVEKSIKAAAATKAGAESAKLRKALEAAARHEEQVMHPEVKRPEVTRAAAKIHVKRAEKYLQQLEENKKLAESTLPQLEETIEKLEKAPATYVIKDEKGKIRQVTGRDIMKLKKARDELRKTVETYEETKERVKRYGESWKWRGEHAEELARRPKATWTLTYSDPRTGETKKETFDSYVELAKRREALRREAKRPTRRIAAAAPPKNNVSAALRELKKFVEHDVKDPKLRREAFKEIAPAVAIAAESARRGDEKAQAAVQKYYEKMQHYEELADYRTPIGVKELTGKDREKYIEKLRARLAHTTMATAEGFATALPATGLAAAGGPLTAGLVSAVGVAAMARPGNRREMAKYIEKHPQQFLAQMAGAVLAGASVSEAERAFKEYTKAVKIKKRRALEKKWDRMIDDVNYLEQQYGAEFPSRLKLEGYEFFFDPETGEFKPVEIWGKAKKPPKKLVKKPEPRRLRTLLLVENPDTGEPMMLVEELQPGVIERLPRADARPQVAGATTTGVPVVKGRQAQILLAKQLVEQYPELRQPFLHPAFRDPNILNKPDLVARAASKKANWSPLLAAALAQAAAQGYITEEQIRKLIRENQRILEKVKATKDKKAVQMAAQRLDVTVKDMDDMLNMILPVMDSVERVVDDEKTRAETINTIDVIQGVAPAVTPVTGVESATMVDTVTEGVTTLEAVEEPPPVEEPPVTVLRPPKPGKVEEEKRRPPRPRIDEVRYVVEHGGKRRVVTTRSIVSAVSLGAPPGAREVKVWRIEGK